jgi:hypothetical protein
MIVAGLGTEMVVTALEGRFPGRAAHRKTAAWDGLNVLLAD